MRNVLVVIVGVVTMDNCKKEKHHDTLDNHTVRKSTEEMDRKLNEAHKRFKDRF